MAEDATDGPAWPTMHADVANARRRAESVRDRTRTPDDADLVGSLSAQLDRLTHRIAELDQAIRANPSTADLDAAVDDVKASVERELADVREADDLARRRELTVTSVDERVQLLEQAIRDMRSENNTLIGYLERAFDEIRGTDSKLDDQVEELLRHFEGELESREERFARTERQISDLHAEALASAETTANDLRSEFEATAETLRLEAAAATADLRDEAQATAEDLREEAEATADALREEAAAAAVELRDRAEEARVLAEKAKDRAEFAADSVAELQADFDAEMDDLRAGLREAATNARLSDAETEIDLRAKHADLHEVRESVAQARARLDELDARDRDRTTEPEPVDEQDEHYRRWHSFLRPDAQLPGQQALPVGSDAEGDDDSSSADSERD